MKGCIFSMQSNVSRDIYKQKSHQPSSTQENSQFMWLEPIGMATLVYVRDSSTYPGYRNQLLGTQWIFVTNCITAL